MPILKKNTKAYREKLRKKLGGVIDPSVGSYANDPFVIKKAEEAKELLRRAPLPERTSKTKK